MALVEVKVPDIGDFKDVPIIEMLVSIGDVLSVDDPIVTLESDKASMEVPSPAAGKVKEIKAKVGESVSEGSLLLLLEVDGEKDEAAQSEQAASPPPPPQSPPPPAGEPAPSQARTSREGPGGSATPPPGPVDFSGVHASPSVRRLARELEIDLAKVKGTGEKGRITKEDVRGFLSGGAAAAVAPVAAGGAGIPEVPLPDFSKFGPIEEKPLSRIKKISGPHLHRAWLNVPAVTHSDEADITETDKYRKELDAAAKDNGYRVTLLSFLMKASVSALRKFPEFNASLSAGKDSLIYKHYYHVGVAVDTPDGLVVPVIRDVDRKGIEAISRELGETSRKARDGKLGAADLQGATFTISSLGGIGGTGFSPIVNAPEVAILGVVRSKMQPVWNGESFEPRNMLPLCVSYDHRVIDGALAARFARHLCHVLEDVRRLVL